LTDEPIHLQAGTVIGQLAPVSDIISIAQDRDPEVTNTPCYLTGVSQSQGESRSSGYRNKYGRHVAERVSVFTPNFVRHNRGHKTQTFYSQNRSSAQNNWGRNWRNNQRNVENHHHRNINKHRRYWFDRDLFTVENQRASLHARHRGTYGQVGTTEVERGFIGLVGEGSPSV